MRRAGYVDILKALCAFLVVCIHAPFPGIVGDYFTALSRVAVPIFFMITGYYYAYTVKQNKSINQIIKIFKCKRLIFRYDRKIPDYFSVAGAP